MKKENINNKDLRIGLISLMGALVILFIIGLFVFKPEPITIQGEADATEVRVSGKIPGRIKLFLTEEGAKIKAGDTVVVIDSPELNAKLEQATAAEDAALAQDRKAQKGARKEQIAGAYEMWQKASVGVDIAKKSYDRVQRLFDKGVVTAQKHDEAEAQYKAAVAQSNAAKTQYDMAVNGTESEDKAAAMAMVNRAKGAVHEVRAYLHETCLVSPIDGEVTEIYPKRGELVGTGAPIMSIVDLNDIWFTFNIREDLLSTIKMGSTFNVKVPALGDKTVQVKVTYIKALASYATWKATKTTGQFDIKTFEVRARPTSKAEGLRPGMSALLEETLK
jgi:HlyD family secretion protein